jgi:hypothetical protein
MDLDLDYSVKRGVVQFTIPGVVQDVYGFSVNKLGNKLGKSPVGKLLPIDFTALSDADFFQKTNIAKSLNKLTKGKFDALKDSVKIKYLDKRTLSFPSGSQPCKMYQVTWNEQALNDLLKSMTGNPVLSKLAGFIKDIIPQIDGDCRCYINEDGYLVGVDLVSLGSKYFFVMEGETNPWDQFSLTVTSLYGDTKVYTGSSISISTSLGYVTKIWKVKVTLIADGGEEILNGQEIKYNDKTYTTKEGGEKQSFTFEVSTITPTALIEVMDKEYTITGDTDITLTVKAADRPSDCTCAKGENHKDSNEECEHNIEEEEPDSSESESVTPPDSGSNPETGTPESTTPPETSAPESTAPSESESASDAGSESSAANAEHDAG